jgi:hypothetical protein
MGLSFGLQQDLVKPNLSELIDESLAEEFFARYYQSLDSKELDREFNKDLKTLTNLLTQFPDSYRKILIDIMAGYIEFYMENKIEREIEDSFFNIIKLR